MSSSRSGRITASAAIGAAFLALTPVAAVAAAPPPTIAACSPVKGKLITYAGGTNSASLTFVKMANTRVNFNQGLKTGCVIVRFTANMDVSTGSMIVRPLLDGGATSSHPSGAHFSSTITTGATFEFIFMNVAPGTHFVQMEYRSVSGGSAHVSAPTTFVQFGQ